MPSMSAFIRHTMYDYGTCQAGNAALLQLETIPADWAGRNRRISISAEYLNSFATLYVDARKRAKFAFRRMKRCEELLKKEYQGDQKVLTSRIESLQAALKEQPQQVARLNTQLEKSYSQVQDIAVKAIEGSAGIKAPAYAASGASEMVRRAGQEAGRGN